MTANQDLVRQMDALYEQYGRPLESDHWGQYVAIATDGRTVLAPSVLEVADRAASVLGPGVFLFKVGEKTVWKMR